MVIHRVVEKKESLRTVAQEYGVSYETVRRLLRAAGKQTEEEEN
jgi:transposase